MIDLDEMEATVWAHWVEFKQWFVCRVRENHPWGPIQDQRTIESLKQFELNEHLYWGECPKCGMVAYMGTVPDNRR